MQAAYLAGILDGEGTISKAPEKCATVYSTDPCIIYAAAWCAAQLGITAMRMRVDNREGCRPQLSLLFYQKPTFLILSKLPLQVEDKVLRLHAILASYRGRRKKDWDRPKADSLLSEGFTPWQVARRVGVDYTTIKAHMRTSASCKAI